MCAPLYDDKGAVRYFIGAQVDVTGLVGEGQGIESFRALLHSDLTDGDSRSTESSNGETPTNGETNSHANGSAQVNGNGNGNGHINGHVNGNGNTNGNTNGNGHTNGHVNGNGNSYAKTVKPASWSDAAKNQDMLDRLRDLSLMLSQDEADVVSKYSREPRITDEYGLPSAAETSADGYSISDGRAGLKARGQGKRIIGSDAGTGGFDLTHLSLNNTLPAPSLPGVYKNVRMIRTHVHPDQLIFSDLPHSISLPIHSRLCAFSSSPRHFASLASFVLLYSANLEAHNRHCRASPQPSETVLQQPPKYLYSSLFLFIVLLSLDFY